MLCHNTCSSYIRVLCIVFLFELPVSHFCTFFYFLGGRVNMFGNIEYVFFNDKKFKDLLIRTDRWDFFTQNNWSQFGNIHVYASTVLNIFYCNLQDSCIFFFHQSHSHIPLLSCYSFLFLNKGLKLWHLQMGTTFMCYSVTSEMVRCQCILVT